MKNKYLSRNSLFERVSLIIESARGIINRTVNYEMVRAYWLIGKEIINEEQKGQSRAEYGKKIIEKLSNRLSEKYGTGWSSSHLWHLRQFYMLYKNMLPENLHTLCAELSWSHYRVLMRIEKPEARAFYEKECVANNWSARELERQKGSLLYERLALSKDKKGLMKLAKKGQELQTYNDMIKDPYVLEFTGLSPQSKLYENKLEQALIDNLSKFLLELGKGFTFVARQKRISLDNKQIFASRYKLYLPTEKELIEELKRERALLETINKNAKNCQNPL